MPQIKHPADPSLRPSDQVKASSVLFGLVIITALIVASAAWMGGSLSAVGKKMSGAMDGMARSIGLSVERVEIEGVSGEHESLVRAAVMIEPGENMFRADPVKIAERVEATGAVTHVRVYRLWPDTILVVATPARPVALHRSGEAWLVIDSGGRVRVDLDASAYPALPRLVGADAPEQWPALLEAIAPHPALATLLEGAVHRGSGRWTLLLEGGVSLKLPELQRAGPALAAIETLQARAAILNGSYSEIDARAVTATGATGRASQIMLMPRPERSASLGIGGQG